MSERLGALDPGTVHAGLAIDSPIPYVDTIDVDAADVAPATDKIVALLRAHGVTRLLVEWSRFIATNNKSRDMAKGEQYPIMQLLVRNVADRCRTAGIRVADDVDIRKPRGRAFRTGLVSRSTWCRWIGAEATIHPETGRPAGVRDANVRAALERHLAGDPALLARLKDTHRRDAAGLLLGWLTPAAQEEMAAAERAEVAREAEVAKKRAEAPPRKKRERVYTREQLDYKAGVARLWYKKRGKAQRRIKFGHKPQNAVEPRLRALLAAGPMAYSDIARAFGQRPASFGATFYPYVTAGVVVKVSSGEREPGKPGRPPARYGLAIP